MRNVHPSRSIDELIARLAGLQHGVVALWQLRDAGFDRHAVLRRVRSRHLHRLPHGVFAVGHRVLTPQGWRMAAVLAGGPAAVLCHRPAGAEWGIRRWNGRQAITVPTDRRLADIDVHRRQLPADEVTVLDGIPITTVPRTLLDLATILDEHDLLTALGEAEKRQLSDPLSLPELLRRHRGGRGTARLRAAMDRVGYGVPIRELEEAFARFIADRGLPQPELNAHLWIENRFVSPDCLWREQRVIVELHSVKHHETGLAISRDARRDRELLIAGWQVIHVTWAQLHDPSESAALARDLRRTLGCHP